MVINNQQKEGERIPLSNRLRKILKLLIAFFAVSCAATLFLAVYLILFGIDPATHFYYDNVKLVTVANVVLLAATFIMLLPFFARRVKTTLVFGYAKRPTLGVFSAITAAALIVTGFDNVVLTISAKAGAGEFFIGCAQVIAAIFFIIASVSQLTGRKIDLRIAALLPVFWSIINLVVTFMSLTSIANISVYLYEVLQMVFAALFLYYNARIISGLTNGREICGAFAFGLPCAMFGFLAAIPSVIAHIADPSRGSLPAIGDSVYIALSLYAIALLVTIVKEKNKAAE